MQSVDFVQMFPSVIIFWLTLVSAMLILYLKAAALGCVTDNVIVEVFCIFGKILPSEVSNHFYSKAVAANTPMDIEI